MLFLPFRRLVLPPPESRDQAACSHVWDSLVLPTHRPAQNFPRLTRSQRSARKIFCAVASEASPSSCDPIILQREEFHARIYPIRPPRTTTATARHLPNEKANQSGKHEYIPLRKGRPLVPAPTFLTGVFDKIFLAAASMKSRAAAARYGVAPHSRFHAQNFLATSARSSAVVLPCPVLRVAARPRRNRNLPRVSARSRDR